MSGGGDTYNFGAHPFELERPSNPGVATRAMVDAGVEVVVDRINVAGGILLQDADTRALVVSIYRAMTNHA